MVVHPHNILPSKPLNQAEIERIRSRDEIEAFIAIGAGSLHCRSANQTGNVTRAVVLIKETVYALEFDDFEWLVERLQQNADRRDHLKAALILTDGGIDRCLAD